MHFREIEMWAALNPEAVQGVQEQAQIARDVWSHLILRDRELDDLAAWCPSGQFCPEHVVSRAVHAAIELAVIVALWPERVSWT